MKKFLKKLFVFSVITIVGLNLFGLFLDYTVQKSNLFKICIAQHGNLPDNIILGGSRALTGIKAEELSKLTGEKWYNLAMDDTGIAYHLLFFKILSAKKKHLKRIVLEYYNSNKKNKTEQFYYIRKNEYQFLPFINSIPEIDKFLRNKDEYLVYKYLPIAKYIYFNTELFYPALLLLVKPKFRYKFNEFGDFTYPNIINEELKMDRKRSSVQLNFNNLDLKDLSKKCKSNQIDLYSITAPIYNSYSKQKFPFKHYNFINLTNDYTDFYDRIHVNDKGSKKLTKAIIDVLN
jgi:hypothetical protein